MAPASSSRARVTRRLLLGTAASATLPLGLGQAAEPGPERLRVVLASAPGALDPHFHNSTPNHQIASALFGALTAFDDKQDLVPDLAVSWTLLTPTAWSFTLRPGVVWSDGAPLTAADVVASYARLPTVPTSIPLTVYTRSIDRVEAGPDGTVVIHTKTPDPLLPRSATRIRIIPERFRTASTGDFNTGAAVIGTGPFVLKSYALGARLELARNDRFWGPKPAWREVVVTFASDAAARTSALLAGDADLIDALPPADVGRLRGLPNIRVASATSNRLIYFCADLHRAVTPYVTDNDGKALATNPFKDLRVRQALSCALNRDAIAERIMGGEAIPAAQFLPRPDGFGADPALRPVAFDPARARALLAEAGYPRGFQLTLHSSNDRYLNDSAVAQAVAQMLTRVGIATKVEVMPWTVYSKRTSSQDFSFCLGSWGANTGEAGTPMMSTVATSQGSAGNGNYGGYSNPALDALLSEALQTLDDAKRAPLLARASRMAIDDVAIIPLHFERSSWGSSRRVVYPGRADQYTLISEARPA